MWKICFSDANNDPRSLMRYSDKTSILISGSPCLIVWGTANGTERLQLLIRPTRKYENGLLGISKIKCLCI